MADHEHAPATTPLPATPVAGSHGGGGDVDPLAGVAADLAGNASSETSPETATLPATSAEADPQPSAMERRWVTDSRGNAVRPWTLLWAHQTWAIVIATVLLLVHRGATMDDDADPAAHTTTPTAPATTTRDPFRDPPWATAWTPTPPPRTPTPPTPPLGGPDPARLPTLGDLQ